MTKEQQLLTDIYTSKELSDCLHKVDESIRDDLRQHVFLNLLDKPEGFILDLHNRQKLKNYIVCMIWRVSSLKNDKFHRMRGFSSNGGINIEIPTDMTIDFKLHDIAEDSESIDKVVSEINTASDSIYWYNKRLFELYMELGTYKAVSDQVGISTMSVFNAVKKAKKQIRELCTK